jgi:hypothetical protein
MVGAKTWAVALALGLAASPVSWAGLVRVAGGSSGETEKKLEKSKVQERDVDKETFEQSASGKELGAIAMATKELDWAKKWQDKGAMKPPRIKEASLVEVGEPIQLVVFLATRDKEIALKEALNYQVSIYKPDGSLQETMEPSLCLPKDSKIAASSMQICQMVMKFELEEDDPRGQWVFKISMEAPGSERLVFGTSFEAY